MYHGERLNAWTHLVGTMLSISGASVLITLAALMGDPWKIVSVSIFGATLILLYSASTLYHSLRGRAKTILRKLDHLSIYLLIAGTYTPFTLVGLRGSVGWWLFGAIWALALAGVVFKLFYTGRFKKLSTAIYIAMGWLVVVAIKPMWQSFDGWTLGWLFAGGLAYTLGTYFYHRESVRYSHAIWHLFVLAGSVCHYIAVLALVVPAR